MSIAFERLKGKYLNPPSRKHTPINRTHLKPINPETESLPPANILSTENINNSRSKSITDYKFGSHISIHKGYHEAALYAVKLGFNCLQIYTTSSKNIKSFDENDAQLCNKYLKDNDVEMWIQCAYFINFCRKCCKSTQYLRDDVIQDLKKTLLLGAKGYVIHVGKLNGKEGKVSRTIALHNFKHNIEKVIEEMLKDDVCEIPWILIKTAAGQGTETPVSVEGLGELFFSINKNYRKYVGFCIDTCHIYVSGECNLKETDEIDNFINKWNQHIGWEHVKLIYLNDSKFLFDSRKNKHVPIGKGAIGSRSLQYFRDFCILTGKPLISI